MLQQQQAALEKRLTGYFDEEQDETIFDTSRQAKLHSRFGTMWEDHHAARAGAGSSTESVTTAGNNPKSAGEEYADGGDWVARLASKPDHPALPAVSAHRSKCARAAAALAASARCAAPHSPHRYPATPLADYRPPLFCIPLSNAHFRPQQLTTLADDQLRASIRDTCENLAPVPWPLDPTSARAPHVATPLSSPEKYVMGCLDGAL